MANNNQPTAPQSANDTRAPVNEDLEVLKSWLSSFGKPVLYGLLAAAVILFGVSIWRHRQAANAAAESRALFQASAPEELRQLALGSPDSPTAPVALSLAGAAFAAADRHEEAFEVYQDLWNRYPDHPLAPAAYFAAASALEAQGEFGSAAGLFEEGLNLFPDHLLYPQAVLSAARCRSANGEFDAARALCEDFIASHPDDEAAIARMRESIQFIDRDARAAAAAPEAETEAVPETATEAEEASETAIEAEPEPAPEVEEPAPESPTDESAPAEA